MRRVSSTDTAIRALHRFLLRCIALVVLGGSVAAFAQDATDLEDPPGRVGKISWLDGVAMLMDLRDGSQAPAELNWPITGGMRLSTASPARAEVRIGSTAIRLDASSVVDFVRIDDSYMQIAVLQGSATVRLRNPDLLNEIEVITQRERILFDETGRYRIDVDRSPGVTSLSVFDGRARILSGASVFAVGEGQRGVASGPPDASYALVAVDLDAFDSWVATRDRRDDELVAARYVSREMTGIESLDQYGHWRTVEHYGAVWFPHSVDSGWAPYRYGRWAYVAPWGWTWIDQTPWGFAPFHYGRWAFIGGTWGWIPGGHVARPVYAPALVAWYGTPGLNISLGFGDAVGWFPLGPGEIFVPHYHHSPKHRERINIHHVRSGHRVTQVREPSYVYREPRFSTWVARDRFDKDPVHRARRNPPSEWRRFVGSPYPPENIPGTKRRQTERSHRGVQTRSEGPTSVPLRPLPPDQPRQAQLPPPARSPAVREWSSAPSVQPRLPERSADRSSHRPQPSRELRSSDAIEGARRFSPRGPSPAAAPAAPAVQVAPPARVAPVQQSAPRPAAPEPARSIGRGWHNAPPAHSGGGAERGGPPQIAGPQSRARER